LNIALPTLLAIAGLIPGIAFLNAYYVGKFPRQLAYLSPFAELALYFMWALPIDAGAIWLTGVLLDRVTLDRPTFDLFGSVFGLGNSNASMNHLYAELESGGGWVWLGCYLVTVAMAFGAGSISRRLVWATRLDIHLPVLRLKAEWYYVLLGRKSGVPRNILPEADVLVEHPEDKSRLYAGVVSGFEVSKDGGIEELYLTAATRWKRAEKKIVDIPGDVLAIPGPMIQSINMRYILVPGPEKGWSRFTWLSRNFWNALVEEA
jgi:hypothetical protein